MRILDEIFYYCMEHRWVDWPVRIAAFVLGVVLGKAIIAVIKFLSAI